LNNLDYFFLVGDFTVAIALAIGCIVAYKQRTINKTYYIMFWIGCLIGSIWEFTFLYLGPEFVHSVKEWPWGLGGWPRKISHSLWDGGLFMVGVFICEKYLKGPLFKQFESSELCIFLSWGIFQELLVEYLFNGRVWIYEPLSWNPVIIPRLPGSAQLCPGYTLIPQAVWVVAPIIFYLIFLMIAEKYDDD
tara:strand:- start:3323 stop:3895 length:573 start_codon:yes stop_codon:yes gene_type:complete